MSDETTVNAGSETSGEQAADTTVQTETTTTDTGTTASQEVAADQSAGGAADETEATPDANASRTGIAEKGLLPGDQCVCPDGRKGTVHRFDSGLVCIPNADQG